MRSLLCALALAAVWPIGAQGAPAGAGAPPGAPEVSILAPADGTALDSTSVDVTVAFAASKPGPGKGAEGNVSLVQLLTAGQVLAAYDNPPQQKSGTHTFPAVDLSLFAGTGATVTLVARAYQGSPNAGRYRDSAPVRVTLGDGGEPPRVVLVSPVDGSLTVDRRPAFRATYTVSGPASDPPGFQALLDGVDVTAAFAVGPTEATWTPAEAIPDGTHTIRLRVTDAAGRVGEAGGSFRIVAAYGAVGSAGGAVGTDDPSRASCGTRIEIPPDAVDGTIVFTIEEAVSFPAFPAGCLRVGSVVDFAPVVDAFAVPARVTVPYDGAAVTAAGLPEKGLRLLRFDAATGAWVPVPVLSVDAAADRVTAEVSGLAGVLMAVGGVLVDPARSEVAASPASLPADGASYAEVRVTPRTVTGELAGPGQDVSVSLSGVGAATAVEDLGDGVYRARVSSGTPGTATVSAAVNGVALGATAAITFVLMDTTAPAITIASPVPGGVQTGTAVALAATVQDGESGVDTASVQIVLNGIDVTSLVTKTVNQVNANGSPAEVGITGALAGVLGTNTLTVRASDLAGNSASAPVSFEIQAEPPPERIVLTIVSGDGQDILMGKATSPLTVQATYTPSGAPAAGVTLVYGIPQLGDILSSIGALGPVTDASGTASLRYIPSRPGSHVVTVEVLGDSTVTPVAFAVQAQTVVISDVSVRGPCNLAYSTSEYPGSALSRLMKVKVANASGAAIPGVTVRPEVSEFDGLPPAFQVGRFMPSVALTDAEGTATFGFVIGLGVPMGSFTMKFSAREYVNEAGTPISVSVNGYVLSDADKPRTKGAMEINQDAPDLSGQSQVGVSGLQLALPLRARTWQRGGGIKFFILEGRGSFQEGTEGWGIMFRDVDACGNPIVGVGAAWTGGDDAIANIKFTPESPLVLIATESRTDVFLVGPPETRVVGLNPSGVSVVKDFITGADFKALTEADRFQIEVVAPNGLAEAPVVDVASRTASDDPRPTRENDVAATSQPGLPTSLQETRPCYTLYRTKPLVALDSGSLYGDAIPTWGSAFTPIQVSALGGIAFQAKVGQQNVDRRLRVLRGASSDQAGKSSLIYSAFGSAIVDFDLRVLGLQNAGADKVQYEFGDGTSLTVDWQNKANHKYNIPHEKNNRRKFFDVTATVYANNVKLQIVKDRVRISLDSNPGGNPGAGPGAPAANLQRDLDAFKWNIGESIPTVPPARFDGIPADPLPGSPTTPLPIVLIKLAADPFVNPTPLFTYAQNARVGNRFTYDPKLPDEALEMVRFDLRRERYGVFGCFASRSAWLYELPEFLAIEGHEANHVVDFYHAQTKAPNTFGALFRVYWDDVTKDMIIPGDIVNQANKKALDALENLYRGTQSAPGPASSVLELGPHITMFTDHQASREVSYYFIKNLMPKLINCFNACDKGIPRGDLRAHVKSEHDRLLVEFPELRYQQEFIKGYQLPEIQ